ncbi:hypothetical protein SAMN05216588_102147 [Pseudomonas flavescens]|uniref:Uncharacterized protein n=1 Tax=Phytopseudomonas flavescens TaxID=29435 RepID=A0A1G7Z065_9GAMM|nr:hypothetical protein [Pseudomonas flavescens]SDH02093.1 hypothetical protein SAMN05216588_102147 [Pseudomonas flavescens]
MASKSDLIRALKIYRERTDDAIAERYRQIGLIKAQLAELLRMVNVDIANVGGLDLIRTEDQHTFDGTIVELESLKIVLAGNTVDIKPDIVDSSLQVIISNLSPEHPSLTVRKEHGQWIVFSSADTFLSQFSNDFLLNHLVDLVNRS